MNFNNDITLRPRFSFEVDQDAKIVLSHFKSHAKTKNNIRVSVVEPHVFLKFLSKNNIFGHHNYTLKFWIKNVQRQ